jgi:sulfur carrier protein ThiS
MILVKVAKIGSAVVEVSLENNASVETALAAAGMNATGFQIRVNGRSATERLVNGDMITLVPAIKGGGFPYSVKVAKIGSAVKEVMLDGDEENVVEDALDAADMESTGFQIRINGRAASLGDRVRANDMVTLVPAIKGGRS